MHPLLQLFFFSLAELILNKCRINCINKRCEPLPVIPVNMFQNRINPFVQALVNGGGHSHVRICLQQGAKIFFDLFNQ